MYLNEFLSYKIETSIAASEKEKISKFTATQRKTESMRGRQEEDTNYLGHTNMEKLLSHLTISPQPLLIQNLNFTAISSVTIKPTKP
jgi:hypothetical protein